MQDKSRVIHIIDDDEAVLDSLAFLLRAAGMEVKTYASAKAFLNEFLGSPSSCVITDVQMPDMSGIDLLRHLRNLKAEVPVIVITGQGGVALAIEAMKIGAADFLEKPIDDELLLASVRTALRQQVDMINRNDGRAEIEAKIVGLSGRELDVLRALIKGRMNKQIAFDLGISPRTVEIYRANLMHKMQAKTLSDLVRMAFIVDLYPI